MDTVDDYEDRFLLYCDANGIEEGDFPHISGRDDVFVVEELGESPETTRTRAQGLGGIVENPLTTEDHRYRRVIQIL